MKPRNQSRGRRSQHRKGVPRGLSEQRQRQQRRRQRRRLRLQKPERGVRLVRGRLLQRQTQLWRWQRQPRRQEPGRAAKPVRRQPPEREASPFAGKRRQTQTQPLRRQMQPQREETRRAVEPVRRQPSEREASPVREQRPELWCPRSRYRSSSLSFQHLRQSGEGGEPRRRRPPRNRQCPLSRYPS